MGYGRSTAAKASAAAKRKLAEQTRKRLDKSAESGIMEAEGVVEEKKLREFFLKQGAKHSAEFFDVGYTSDNPEKLKKDFLSALAIGERRDPQQTEHGERFSILSELGVTKKKLFRTVWQIDTPDGLPRIITAHREDDD